MVTRKYSLNSKAAGNLNGNGFIIIYERQPCGEDAFTGKRHSFTWRVSCQTQSTNWIKTGERSASVWFLSPWPMRWKKRRNNVASSSVTQLQKPPDHPREMKSVQKIVLPAGSGDRSSATLSLAAPRSHERSGSDRPASAWLRRWAVPCGPIRHCSEPPLTFSQTPLYRRSAALPPGSAEDSQKCVRSVRSLDFNLIHLSADNYSKSSLCSPWCAQASAWTPGWRTSASPRCWGKPRPLACGVTPSSRGCCGYPRTPAQRSDRHPRFRNRLLSSDANRCRKAKTHLGCASHIHQQINWL